MLTEEQTHHVLRLLGQIATAQPMEPNSFNAEALLVRLGCEEYIHRCSVCHDLPSPVTIQSTPPRYLCEECRAEELGEVRHADEEN